MVTKRPSQEGKAELAERLMLALRRSSAAGVIGRRTGLSSGAVTGLIDRLEKLGLVERTADPNDRRKVLVRVREDRIAPIAIHFAPLEKRMQALLSSYNREELETLLDFAERSSELLLARVTELNNAE